MVVLGLGLKSKGKENKMGFEIKLEGAVIEKVNIYDSEVNDLACDRVQVGNAFFRNAEFGKVCTFEGACMWGAIFDGADLSYAKFKDADLDGADFSGATWDDQTVWPEGIGVLPKDECDDGRQ